MYKAVKAIKKLKKPLNRLNWKNGNLFLKVLLLKDKLKEWQSKLDGDPFDAKYKENFESIADDVYTTFFEKTKPEKAEPGKTEPKKAKPEKAEPETVEPETTEPKKPDVPECSKKANVQECSNIKEKMINKMFTLTQIDEEDDETDEQDDEIDEEAYDGNDDSNDEL
nr:hypothetical protein [Tanacetum cinerariifolium]